MGTLYIVSTPIGNLEDITIRAIKTLLAVGAILCEDTRRTGLLIHEMINRYGKLLSSFDGVKHSGVSTLSNEGHVDHNPDWKPTLIPYYDQIEEKKLPEIIEMLQSGKDLALVSDAGTPLISDPGFRLVRECIRRGITVESIPGPSALLAALTSSGLPPNQFLFLGYPSEKSAQMKQLFSNLLQCINTLLQKPTVIFYCAPHKLQQALVGMKEVFGDIEIVIARELTKIHEEVWRGKLSEAQNSDFKGELVLLFRL